MEKQQKIKKEEKLEEQIQNIINTQMEEIKEQIKKEKVNLTLEKFINLHIIEFHLYISTPKENSQENYEFLLNINLIYIQYIYIPKI